MASFDLPESLAEYRIVRTLGEGGMGVVYLAHDQNLDRLVALKLIADADPDSVTRARFLNEARALARLRHPNIVTIHRVGETDGRPFLVSEFLFGRSWDQITRPAPIEEVSELALGAARGLAAAHRAGVLHRDIKPANLFVTEQNEVKLIDFGLAKVWVAPSETTGAPKNDDGARIASPTATTVGTVIGTPAFLSPELWLEEPASTTSDVYAFGVTLFVLLCGSLPHTATSLTELKRKVVDEDAPPVRSLRPETPVPLAALVDRCLRRNPFERPPTAEEVRQELESLVHASLHLPLPDGNPYRGLFAFDTEHRGLFFGRDREVGDVLDRLRAAFPVVVTGGSGAGKSSLVRAGVVPRIKSGALNPPGTQLAWTTVTITPGQTPLAHLESALETTGLEEDPGRFLATLGDRGLLVVVDQAEEVGLVTPPAERTRFLGVLEALLGSPRVRVLATARSDFLGELPTALTRSVYVLEPLSEEGVRAAVLSPAAAHGYRFESSNDVDTLVGSTAGRRGSLPLLSFALAKLWDARDLERKLIPQHALAKVGGVEGALAAHAEQTLAALPPDARELCRRIFLQLLTRQRTRLRRPRSALAGGPAALVERTLEALLASRLVTSDRGWIEVAHESLVVSWPRLGEWLAADDAKRRVAEQVEAAAAEWLRLGRPADLLWRGRQLEEASLLGDAPLGAGEGEFLARSRRAQTLARWRRGGLLVAAPTLVLAAVLTVQAVNRRAALQSASLDVREGELLIGLAGASARVNDALLEATLHLYDRGDEVAGLALLRQWRRLTVENDESYDRVLQAINQALAKVAGHPPAKRLGADLYAERVRRLQGVKDVRLPAHARQLAFYDDERRYTSLLSGAGTLQIDTHPSGARVSVIRLDEGRPLGAPLRLGTAPVTMATAVGNSYLFLLEADGLAPATFSLRARREEDRSLTVPLLPAAAIPDGFTYVPPGPALVGREETALLEATRQRPAHEVSIPGFFIGRNEVTTAEWLRYLAALPAAKRREILQQQAGLLGERNGQIVLEVSADRIVAQGEPFRFTAKERGREMASDWGRWPIVLVSGTMAVDYARWAGARLCTENEWEKAARGGDGRHYPHGPILAPSDASQSATYGGDPSLERWFDEVGLYPASRSLYGADDMIGNVAEWVHDGSPSGFVAKGGAFSGSAVTLRADYRTRYEPGFYGYEVGFRLCRDLPAP